MSLVTSTLPPLPTMISVSPVPAQSSWTFTQGLLLGQASILVIFLLFVRYVVFSPSEVLDDAGWKRRREERLKRTVLSTNAVPPPPASSLLGKTGYEMGTHPAESTDWLNVLSSQVLQGYRNDLLSAGGEEGARKRIEIWLNPDQSTMSWLDPIHVTALSLGTSFPLLSNARIRPADGLGRVRAEIDIDYLDSVSLALSTAVLINFPRPRFAVLPVSLGVELVSIGGTLSMQIHDPVDERQHVHVCLLPDFHLNLKTTSLLGSRAKLQDIPKLEQIILARLRAVVQDRFVYPNFLSLALPRLLNDNSSAQPIIEDIGESAVTAMGDAVKTGLSQMMGDLSGGNLPTPDTNEVVEQTMIPISRRKITMPAGFPHSTNSTSSSTPLHTPGPRPPRPLPMHNPSQRSLAPSATVSSTHRVQPQSSTGRSEASQIRFRGQFSSQPNTPAVEADRRLGVLNARPV